MIHLTSLLICLVFPGFNTLQSARSSKLEAKPDPPAWERRYGVAGPRSFHPSPLDSIKAHQKQSSVINPKSIGFEIQGPPSHTHDSGSSKYHYKHPPGSSKPGWNIKFSLPSFTTTTPPTPKSDININAGFSYSGGAQDPSKMPGSQKQSIAQKLSQPFETFFSKLIPGGSSGQSSQSSQTIIQTQHEKGVFKPQLSHGHKWGHSHPSTTTHHYYPDSFGMGHSRGSTGASDSQKPAQQSVYHPPHPFKQDSFGMDYLRGSTGASDTQKPAWQSVYHPPKWSQLHKPQTYDVDLKKDVLQYAKFVNGQYMIPVDKCPGFETFPEYLKEHYHQHGKLPYGYGHQHKRPQHLQTQHGHVHQHWPPPHSHYPTQSPTFPPTTKPPTAKPNYAEFFLHVGGPAPNPGTPTEETNVNVHGVYKEYPTKWQNTFPGAQKHLKPGQTYTYLPAPYKQQAPEQSHHVSYENPSLLRPAWR